MANFSWEGNTPVSNELLIISENTEENFGIVHAIFSALTSESDVALFFRSLIMVTTSLGVVGLRWKVAETGSFRFDAKLLLQLVVVDSDFSLSAMVE